MSKVKEGAADIKIKKDGSILYVQSNNNVSLVNFEKELPKQKRQTARILAKMSL